VTTSSTYEEPGLYDDMDYEQPHSYSPNPYAPMSQILKATKPAFYGEFGTEPYVEARERTAVRDGVLASVLAGHSGATSYWYWDRAFKDDFHEEFKRLSSVLARVGIAQNPDSQPLPVRAETAEAGNLSMSPTIGWGKSTRTSFNLPEDGLKGSLPISAYLQSVEGPHKDYNPNGFTFRTNLKKAGLFRVHLVQSSAGGGALRLTCGSEKVEKSYAAGERGLDEWLSIPVPPGPQTVGLSVLGADWLRIGEIEVQGAGPLMRAQALGQAGRAVLRLTAMGGSVVETTVRGLGLADGSYEVLELDLDSPKETKSSAKILSGQLRYTPRSRDALLLLTSATP
jgi:hypothetical protein